MHLADLYADFTAVLRTTEPGRAVVDNVLLPENSQEIEVADVLSSSYDTSLAEKLESGAYEKDVLPFFHDLKLAFGRVIATFPQNAPEYEELSQLFKFSTDLLIREAHRSGLTRVVNAEDDEYIYRLSIGFQKITTELQDYNGETFWATAASGPLFMSATNKAPFDPRDTAVAGSVHTVTLLPHVARAPDSTLGVAAPLNTLLPQPYATPSDMMSRFVHPNEHTTVPPSWLESADHYDSFAPRVDSAGAVTGPAEAAQVWRMQSQSHAALAENGAENGATRPLEPIVLKLEEGLNLDDKTPLQATELEALLRWSPYSFVDDDELEARRNGTELELVSSLLIKLQDYQRARFTESMSLQDVSDSERHTALKISNILGRLVADASPEDIKLDIDPRLPVLMRNYAGSLPQIADAPPLQPPPSRGDMGNQRLRTLASLRQRRM